MNERGLTVRLAIASGEIVAKDTSDLFGAPLERGLTLARAAAPAEVLLDEIDAAFGPVCRRDRAHGRGQGVATRGPRERRRCHATCRSHGGPPSRSSQASLEVFGQAERTREAHLLTVIGEAGIGKSRLAEGLADRLAQAATVLTGRCLSYGEGIAFWPWREVLAQAAGSESRDALSTLLAGAPDGEMVAGIIASTLQLAPAESVSEQVPWAFRRLLEVISLRRPLLLVIEDAHWADPALLELIEYLVDWLRSPVTVLALARAELLEARPSWGGGHPAHAIGRACATGTRRCPLASPATAGPGPPLRRPPER